MRDRALISDENLNQSKLTAVDDDQPNDQTSTDAVILPDLKTNAINKIAHENNDSNSDGTVTKRPKRQTKQPARLINEYVR